jgi:hypothetical protein
LANAGAQQLGSASPQPQTAPTQPVRRRQIKNYLIDKKLQLSYVLFVTILSGAIAGTLGYLLYAQEHYASRTISRSLDDVDFLDDDAKKDIRKGLKEQDTNEVAVMLVVGLGLVTVLTGYLIIMTHKVAGPLYKVSLYFDKMRDGKLPQVYDLRKGDQLRDFFDKFKQMDEALRERAKSDIALLTRFLADCDAAGVATAGELGHRLDELRKLTKEKEASLS